MKSTEAFSYAREGREFDARLICIVKNLSWTTDFRQRTNRATKGKARIKLNDRIEHFSWFLKFNLRLGRHRHVKSNASRIIKW
jgi:hypothetical protein